MSVTITVTVAEAPGETVIDDGLIVIEMPDGAAMSGIVTETDWEAPSPNAFCAATFMVNADAPAGTGPVIRPVVLFIDR